MVECSAINVLKHYANTVHEKDMYFRAVNFAELALCSVTYRTVSTYSILKVLPKCPSLSMKVPSGHTYRLCKV